MFTIANQSIINIRSDTDLQNAKNVRKFEFRGHGLRISLNFLIPKEITIILGKSPDADFYLQPTSVISSKI